MDLYARRFKRRSRIARAQLSNRRRVANTMRGAVPASRTLARARSAFRVSNPRSISIANARTMSFTRTIQFSLPLNEQLGWSSLGSPNLSFSFSLARTIGYLAGAPTYISPTNNVAEFTTLFDYYKVGNVKMKMFFTNNNSSVNSPATALPIIHICNDYDDATGAETLNTILERAGTRTVQFSANNTDGITHYCKPNASTYVQDVDGTGIVTSVGGGIAPADQWINTGTPGVVHNAIKVFYNNQGRANNTDIGSVSFFFEIEFIFKGYR